MACLIKTKYSGKVTWLGRVNLADKGIRSVPMKNADVTFDGILGEAHSGATRPSCVRVTMLHPQGTEIRNSRQITILSAEENAEIAKIMGLEKLELKLAAMKQRRQLLKKIAKGKLKFYPI